MKNLLAVSGTLLALLTALAASARAQGIVITEVMSSSSHPGGTSNADWFELTNSGTLTIDLTGWSWDDDTNVPGTADFSSSSTSVTQIAPGQSIIITGETLGTTAENSFRTDWGLAAGVVVVNLGSTEFQSFSSTGDALYIYDATSAVVASVAFGTATAGSTFEWDTAGNSLGTSVVGENGAHKATFNGASAPGTDIGSPGLAVVPEPSTIALAVCAGMTLALRRQRR